MAKLKSVIRHEYLTIVKQPSFWAIMIAVPLLIAAVLGLTYLGNTTSENRIQELAKDLKNVAIIDESGLINEGVVTLSGLSVNSPNDFSHLHNLVRDGKKEALVVYPANLAHDRKYTIYLSNSDLTKMSSVTSLADTLLKTSLFLPLGSADIIALAQNGAQTQLITYKNGRETAGINEYIVPGVFVLLFYLIFAFSVGYMLSSVSEEKENRSMEMVLTYVKPRILIIGKLLAVILVILTQLIFFALLLITAFFIAKALGTSIALPAGIDLQRLVFDPAAIFFGASFLIVGFLMFAGFMITTAALTPSAKEANSFSAVFYIGAFVPFYFIMMILTNPENPVTKFVTFFPLTSPVVALLRNTVGNMDIVESSLALLTMTIFMVISIGIAVRSFGLGALEFSNRIKLRSLLKK